MAMRLLFQQKSSCGKYATSRQIEGERPIRFAIIRHDGPRERRLPGAVFYFGSGGGLGEKAVGGDEVADRKSVV